MTLNYTCEFQRQPLDALLRLLQQPNTHLDSSDPGRISCRKEVSPAAMYRGNARRPCKPL